MEHAYAKVDLKEMCSKIVFPHVDWMKFEFKEIANVFKIIQEIL